MDQIRCFGDEWILVSCVYCGIGPIETRDHVPSRILLDDPFPENLPVVPACQSCNQEFSRDEEYLACLIECAICGGTNAEDVCRPKIARVLTERPRLAARLKRARHEANGLIDFRIEEERVLGVIAKLARGHAAFDLHEPKPGAPVAMVACPMRLMPSEKRSAFENAAVSSLWPEVGSRAMVRIGSGMVGASEWIEVQSGRYRYLAAVTESSIIVRMVLSEYLAGEVIWSSN